MDDLDRIALEPLAWHERVSHACYVADERVRRATGVPGWLYVFAAALVGGLAWAGWL